MLPGPGRPLPAELGWDAEQHPTELGQKPLVDLRLAVAGALVEQTVLPEILVALGGAHHGRRGAPQVASDLMPGESLVEFEDHEVA